MKRPDLNTLACVNPACPLFRRPGEGHLTVRNVSGHDQLRLLRCCPCGEACSERRGSALFHTKIAEEKAADVITHVDEGCGVRATARLGKGSKDTVARLLRLTGRQAERFHDQQVHDLTPLALEFDEQGSFVKKSRSVARGTRPRRPGIGGTIPRSQPTASSWGLGWSASARRNRPVLWGTTPSVVSGRGICPHASPRPTRATNPLF